LGTTEKTVTKISKYQIWDWMGATKEIVTKLLEAQHKT
jgi:hypothetical protein